MPGTECSLSESRRLQSRVVLQCRFTPLLALIDSAYWRKPRTLCPLAHISAGKSPAWVERPAGNGILALCGPAHGVMAEDGKYCTLIDRRRNWPGRNPRLPGAFERDGQQVVPGLGHYAKQGADERCHSHCQRAPESHAYRRSNGRSTAGVGGQGTEQAERPQRTEADRPDE